VNPGPSWLTWAAAELGETEIKGRKHNLRIVQYQKLAFVGGRGGDERDWCAIFLNAALESSGVPGTRKSRAKSFLEWGEAIDPPALGAIAVLSRSAAEWQGHCGFYVGEIGASLFLLGGNQGDSVSIATFPRQRLLGYRWPKDGPVPTWRGPFLPFVPLMQLAGQADETAQRE
jgi:uncharacterized protein (TIGR02594 family)